MEKSLFNASTESFGLFPEEWLEYHLPTDLLKDDDHQIDHANLRSLLNESQENESDGTYSASMSYSFDQDSTSGGNNYQQRPLNSGFSNHHDLQSYRYPEYFPKFSVASNYQRLFNTQRQAKQNEPEPQESPMIHHQSPYPGQKNFITPLHIHPVVSDFLLGSVNNCTSFFIENRIQQVSAYLSPNVFGFSHPLFELSQMGNVVTCSVMLNAATTW